MSVSENKTGKLETTHTASVERRYPKRLLLVHGFLLLLLITNALLFVSQAGALAQWPEVSISRIVTLTLNVMTLIFGGIVLIGMWRRRPWSLFSARIFFAAYVAAMVAKQFAFSPPVATPDWIGYGLAFVVLGGFAFGLIAILGTQRVADYYRTDVHKCT